MTPKPRGTPAGIIDTLRTAVVAALRDPDVRNRAEKLGQEIVASDQQGPQALRALQEAETGKWWPIIQAANIKAN